MSKVRLFIIADEGEYNELPFQNKDQLDSEEVYLIVDESGKDIWIYKGANARIRKIAVKINAMVPISVPAFMLMPGRLIPSIVPGTKVFIR